jgi:hypothetical protein
MDLPTRGIGEMKRRAGVGHARGYHRSRDRIVALAIVS